VQKQKEKKMSNRANIGWQLANMLDNEHLAAGTASGVGPSPKIWSSCPVLPIMLDPTKGFVYFNDFLEGFTDVSADGFASGGGGLKLTEASAGTLKNLPALPGGVVEILSAAATVDTGAVMQIPGCEVEPASGTTIYMEWRCLINVGGGQMFMGLCNDDTTSVVANTDLVVTNKDYAGFYRDSGTGDTDWSVGVCDGSSSETADDKVTAASESAYEKFGLVFEGIGAVSGSKVTFFHKGEPVYATHDINDLPLLLMCPVFQAHSDGTDTAKILLDWVRIAVYHKDGTCRDTDGS